MVVRMSLPVEIDKSKLRPFWAWHTDPKHFSGPNVEFGSMERASHLVSQDLSLG
jgi:hypothetical protein